MTEFRQPLIVDIGARFGLHPSLRPFEQLAEIHLVEPDPEEAARLKGLSGQKNADVTVHPLGLANEPGQLTLKLRRHRALSSFYSFNEAVFDDPTYMRAELEDVSEVAVPISTVDLLMEGRRVDFLKSDTEGADFDVLMGARGQLEANVLAVRCEVIFADIIPGRPHFGEIDGLLSKLGFQLLNLDYNGAGVASSPFTRPGRYGQLLSTDATWVKRPQFFQGMINEQRARDTMVLAHFLFNNHASDVAMWHIMDALSVSADMFDEMLGSPLTDAVRADMAKLIKDLSYVPGGQHTELQQWYQKLFKSEFPPLYEYYYHFSS